MRKIFVAAFLLFICGLQCFPAINVSHIVVLNKSQQEMLQQMVNTNLEARRLWHELKQEADLVLTLSPQPLATLKYSGYAGNNDDRIDTEMALYDMDCLGILYYAIICSDDDTAYVNEARTFILSWSKTYVPEGNPENEDKMEPLFHCYFLIRDHFSTREQEQIEDWMIKIADRERKNDNLPMDRKEAQRIKTIGTLGYLLNEPDLVKYAINSFKRYVEVSLYPDGTSFELSKTEVLGNHVVMLEALVSFGITFRQFEGAETQMDVYKYESPNGSSVKKSVEFVEPYAKGSLKYQDKYNNVEVLESTMADDYNQAAISGEWFNPASANTLMELAAFFNKPEKQILLGSSEKYYSYESWLGLIVKSILVGS